jgi:hypothetical protein
MFIFINGSKALCWALAAFSVSSSFTQSVGLLGRGISPTQGRYLHTGQHKHADIHATSGILTHDPRVHPLERAATVIGVLSI